MDILGDAGAERYAKAVEIVAKDPNSDGVLVILTPQAMTEPTATAKQLKPFAKLLENRSLRVGWAAIRCVPARRSSTAPASRPSPIPTPRRARSTTCGATATTSASTKHLPSALTPTSMSRSARMSRRSSERRAKGGGPFLTEIESKEILAARHSCRRDTAHRAKKKQSRWPGTLAARRAQGLLRDDHAQDDVGGVKLNLRGAAAVRRAYREIERAVSKHNGHEDFLGVTVEPMISLEGCELILGSSLDPQFGPVLLFGAGGQLVEVFNDRALGLPPLNATLARRLMEQTRIFAALKGVRGRSPVDLAALDQLLVRFSQLVAEQRWIKEIDINPLVASASGLIALDARMVLHSAEVSENELPPLRSVRIRRNTSRAASSVTARR